MRTALREEAELSEAIAPAIDAILGANPFVGLDTSQIVVAIGNFISNLGANPGRLTSGMLQFGTDLAKIVLGRSEIAPAPNDKRFSDPTWSDNLFYNRLMQTYLAWRQATLDLVKDDSEAGARWKVVAQERFAVSLLTEALAPTNTLAGNPAALKRAFEKGGLSLLAEASNLASAGWMGLPALVSDLGKSRLDSLRHIVMT